MPEHAVREARLRAAQRRRGLFAIGVELLPWMLIGVIVDESGRRLFDPVQVPLLSMTEVEVVARIAELAKRLLRLSSLDMELTDDRLCIGIEVGGPVDRDNGVVKILTNSPDDAAHHRQQYAWHEFPLARRVEKLTGCATFIENDASAWAAHELAYGAGRSTDSFGLVLIRHGVGGAIVRDGRREDAPTEIGHIQGPCKQRRCDCGNRGCIESIAGQRATTARIRETTGLEGTSFEWAVDLANENSKNGKLARTAFEEAGDAIAYCIATMANLWGSPQVVVYGPKEMVVRDYGRAARAFVKQLRQFPEYTYPLFGKCQVTIKPLRRDYGAQGAALVALDRYFSISL